MVKYLK